MSFKFLSNIPYKTAAFALAMHPRLQPGIPRFNWITDTQFTRDSSRDQAYHLIRNLDFISSGCVLHTGNISNKDIKDALYDLKKYFKANKPLFFILGPNDYVSDGLETTREYIIKEYYDKMFYQHCYSQTAFWLNHFDHVPLTDTTAIVGIDGVGKNHALHAMQAQRLQEQLLSGHAAGFRQFVVATHDTPHFPNINNLEHDYSEPLRETLENFCQQDPSVHLDVYCGQPHSIPFYYYSPNITLHFAQSYAVAQSVQLMIEPEKPSYGPLFTPTSTENKVVFLDIDGVLQSLNGEKRFKKDLATLKANLGEQNKYFLEMDEYDIGAVYYDWDENAVQYLLQLCKEHDARIVVSSTWRENKSWQHLKALFGLKGLSPYMRDRTPVLHLGGRGLEIETYLAQHPEITHFVILDDAPSDFPKRFPGNFVECRNVLREAEFQQANKFLQNSSSIASLLQDKKYLDFIALKNGDPSVKKIKFNCEFYSMLRRIGGYLTPSDMLLEIIEVITHSPHLEDLTLHHFSKLISGLPDNKGTKYLSTLLFDALFLNQNIVKIDLAGFCDPEALPLLIDELIARGRPMVSLVLSNINLSAETEQALVRLMKFTNFKMKLDISGKGNVLNNYELHHKPLLNLILKYPKLIKVNIHQLPRPYNQQYGQRYISDSSEEEQEQEQEQELNTHLVKLPH